MSDIKLFEVPRITRDWIDDVKVGDWYWVQDDITKYNSKTEQNDVVGSEETLACVEEIGSNYVGLTVYTHDGACSRNWMIHFSIFLARCRPEPNWRALLDTRMNEARANIQAKTRELVEEGQRVCLLSVGTKQEPEQEAQSLMPALVTNDPKKYKAELIALQNHMPVIHEEIKELGHDFACAAKNLYLPDLCKLGQVTDALSVINDRIFTVELYCGLQEQVHQIAKGEPAPIDTVIAIRQQLLYMDEETMFNYKDGGMDFGDIGKFDKWVATPENLNRVLPDQRGIVAFQVRRLGKNYGVARTMADAWAHAQWAINNKMTYLLIRNGGNVYRIASEVDFSPRLIPKVGEIGQDQFTHIDESWVFKKDKKDRFFGGSHEKVVTEKVITQDDVEFDKHMGKMEKLLRHYNRIVVLIQGLLDRSTVFHPHTKINLRSATDMGQWIDLVRDEERGLPCNKIDWPEYRKQLNSTLRKGKWIYIDCSWDANFKGGERDSKYDRPRRGYRANTMPTLCKVDIVKRDGSMVRVSWPWGHRAIPLRGKWIENPKKPGWGHYEWNHETERMCHEWVPVTRVLNVSDYQLGDYKMFLCDRALQGAYLQWAQYLLTAENWARARAKGVPAEEEQGAKV